MPTFGLEPCDVDASRKITFDGLNKEGQGIELYLPGKQKWPTKINKDGKIVESERKKICMIPQVTDLKRGEDRHLSPEQKVYGAALQGIPCPTEDPSVENPYNYYLVN